MEGEINEETENNIINEEYKIWKKNCPFLYDLVVTHELEWPSLTVQWLPQKDVNHQDGYAIHKLILGTHADTSNSQQNYLMIAKVRLPIEETVTDLTEYKTNNNAIGGLGNASQENRIEIEMKINHESEINRARYMPQKPNIIASRTCKGEIHLFDFPKHPIKPANDQVKPDLRLQGHTEEGYGLSWNPNKEGHLISAGYDKKICYWDIQKNPEIGSVVSPLSENQYHQANVEDVCWNYYNPEIFASVSDDKNFAIWDCRQDFSKPFSLTEAHNGEIYSIDFNPFNQNLFITASEDHNVALWDLRNTSKRLHTFEGHEDHVLRCEWSPFNLGVFCSSSADRRVIVWDLSKCGQEIKGEDEQDGAPEKLFVHGGHRAKVNDFSWNQNDPLVIASVEENNIIQVWQMASNIYEDDEDNIREELASDKK